LSAHSEFQIPPIKGEQRFQELCLALVRREWNDRYATLFGRRGQRQGGVDIAGKDHTAGSAPSGVQCKGTESDYPRELSTSEIDEEVEKAKKQKPPIKLLIVAVAGKRDAALQSHASQITEKHEPLGLFRVVVWAWDDIRERLSKYPDLESKYLVIDRSYQPSAIDPARPIAPSVDELSALAASLQTRVSALDEATKADVADAADNAKLDLWRDQLREGDGAKSSVIFKTSLMAECRAANVCCSAPKQILEQR
jgi:hypothetical protein